MRGRIFDRIMPVEFAIVGVDRMHPPPIFGRAVGARFRSTESWASPQINSRELWSDITRPDDFTSPHMTLSEMRRHDVKEVRWVCCSRFTSLLLEFLIREALSGDGRPFHGENLLVPTSTLSVPWPSLSMTQSALHLCKHALHHCFIAFSHDTPIVHICMHPRQSHPVPRHRCP
jgi:hypothetical protein